MIRAHLIVVLASCVLVTPAIAQQGPVRPIQPIPRDSGARPARERPASPRPQAAETPAAEAPAAEAPAVEATPVEPREERPGLKRKVPLHFDSARASVPFNIGIYGGAGYDVAALTGPSRGFIPRLGALLLIGDELHFAASISAEIVEGPSFIEYGAAVGWQLLSLQANLVTSTDAGDSASLGAQLNLHLPLVAGAPGDQSAIGIFLRPYAGLLSNPSAPLLDGRIAAVAGVELMMMFGFDPEAIPRCSMAGW